MTGESDEETGPVMHLDASNRMEGFSDGVLAITITLLVFDVRRPEHEPGRLMEALLRQWPTYVAFLASFLYIGVIWTNHHAAFGHIQRADRGLKWANLGILLTSALLPFPTSVLATAMRTGTLADERAAIAVYAFIAALMCLSWLVFYRYVAEHPHLLAGEADRTLFRREPVRAIVGLLLYAGAGVLGQFTGPAVALSIFLALPLFYALTSDGLPVRARR